MFGVTRIVELALEEDVAFGDVTSDLTVPHDRECRGQFLAKADGVVSGVDAVREVFRQVDPDVVFEALVTDGDHIQTGQILGRICGRARSVLMGERVALNFLQRLSGVATATAQYVDAVDGTRARVIDTRKTTPGMRQLEKRAVRHGGGHNHRFGLADGILIKDNHLAAIGGSHRISSAIAAARADAPHPLRIEVEVTSHDELREALDAGADAVLLDNMTVAEMAEAVRIAAGRVVLEASGGITLDSIRAGCRDRRGPDLRRGADSLLASTRHQPRDRHDR